MNAVDGIDPAELGKALGIPVQQERMVEALPAPLSWPVEKRSVTNRELAATWSWDRGLFRMDTAQEEYTVRLERYRRARGDDRDVFLVVLPGHAAKAFTARTSAILEAHRLAERVLFTFDGILLRRLTRDGCLPDPVARMLRLTYLVNSGLLPDREGVLSLAYRADLFHARMLGRLFGPAIGNIDPQQTEDDISTIAFARHRGRANRFIWRERLSDPRVLRSPSDYAE
jgi:hypothetical protein